MEEILYFIAEDVLNNLNLFTGLFFMKNLIEILKNIYNYVKKDLICVK